MPDPYREMESNGDSDSESDELQASPVSEKIEDLVKQKLQEHSDLRDVVIDFGTSLDGSLEIWIDSERYLNVEDIPDERIRKAIGEAVEDFNA
ncbi:MAG: hypothetical protein AMJ88_09875 [Anaerolineae bacterium SM23_ 63]|nr:MAG: hypothetical protein AMJ88_09875 [Anaerolineae bacterium SM23_ 63]HEY46011.1 hypothetical protein [Anaerolineae bacterium]